MNLHFISTISLVAAAASPSLTAHAAAPPGDGESEASAVLDVGASSGSDRNLRWAKRHTPRPHDIFLGAFGGVWVPASNIGLGDADRLGDAYEQVAGDVGVRLGYYPVRHFGMEGELAALPAGYGGDTAFAYSARLQGVLQLGFWRITPFVLLGGGVLGVRSGADVVGNDADSALHVGGGLKMLLSKRLQLRLDVRDVISEQRGPSLTPVHSPEALLTFAVRFGAAPKPAPVVVADRDGDGVADEADHCPYTAGADGKGCPWPDSDCDDVTDNVDACPEQAGVAPQGCPPPDSDGDGILDDRDQCPQEAGIEPDGCPDADPDRDGIIGSADACPTAAETANGFEDADGCPDELPAEVAQFNGVIQGIFFDTGNATIKSTSEAVLDNSATVLAQYPDLRVEIVGHTDDRGSHDGNVALSQRRADSVKAYLVSKGVASSRILTRGAGPDQPMADNASKAGRAKNRRIEFKLVTAQAGGAGQPK